MSDAGDRRQALRAGSASHKYRAGILANKPRTKPVACRKCHARKVKCSGGKPCANCRQLECPDDCVYPARDRQVRVSQNYIEELLEENERLRESTRTSHSSSALPTPNPATAAENDRPADVSENDEAERNPLLEDRAWFFPMNTSEMPIHIGEAADAAFATRFRQALSDTPHRHIPRTQYVTGEELMALTDVDCQWPTAPRARFLVKVSLNTICQRFHAIRRSALLDGLEMAIRNPTCCDELFKCKLYAMFALGEVFSTRTVSAQGYFPGLLYFARASRMLRFVVLATRPILLHVFRTYRESLRTPANSPTPPIPETARALAEACIRCARHSYRLLTESWIDGAFATFGYFDTQYLFSAATILAISSFLNSKDAQSDGDHFETAAQFLGQLMQNGNFAAKEFCQHIDAMRRIMQEARGTEPYGADPSAAQASAAAGAVQGEEFQYTPGSMVTAGMALAEPSLQEFLSQPDIDLRFIDTSIYDGGLQSLYWPDLRGEDWMAGGP
ncbi:putative fungal specific transcription factor [Diplodia seriata]|uniref:Putative fungal specific transcription factor n=1 Tax=Diplodia seriata TaxID=420778 RepID=A0A0G2ETH9_9PEZI|nr:putative fungal specific transcription factor [Diplodia seriata]